MFGAVSLLWSLLIPAGEGPDELAHLRLAEYVWSTHSFPDASAMHGQHIAEAFQMPLYYILISPFIGLFDYSSAEFHTVDNPNFDRTSSPGRANVWDNARTREQTPSRIISAVHVIRTVTVLTGALAIWWICLALEALHVPLGVGMLTVSVWASLPMTTFMSSVVGNDVPAALFCAIAFLGLVKWERSGSVRDGLLVVLALTLGLLMKLTILYVWAGTVLVILLHRGLRQRRFQSLMIVLLPVLVCLGSILRSFSLQERKTHPAYAVSLHDGILPYAKSWIISLVKTVYTSFLTAIGVVGQHSVYFPGWFYGIFFGVLLVCIWAVWDAHRRNRWEWYPAMGTPYWIALMLLSASAVYGFRESGETMTSRYVIPYMPGILAVFATALSSAFGDRQRLVRPRRSWFFLVTGVLFTLLGFLPSRWWFPVVFPVVAWARFSLPLVHYQTVLSLLLSTFGVSFLVVFLWQRYFSRITDFVMDLRPKRALVFCASLFLMNMALLVLHVRRFYT